MGAKLWTVVPIFLVHRWIRFGTVLRVQRLLCPYITVATEREVFVDHETVQIIHTLLGKSAARSAAFFLQQFVCVP